MQQYQLLATIAKHTNNRNNANMPVTGNNTTILVIEKNATIPVTGNNCKKYN